MERVANPFRELDKLRASSTERRRQIPDPRLDHPTHALDGPGPFAHRFNPQHWRLAALHVHVQQCG